MTPDERIFSLMAIAEEQQKQIDSALVLQKSVLDIETNLLAKAREDLFESYRSTLNELKRETAAITQQNRRELDWKMLFQTVVVILLVCTIPIGGFFLYVEHSASRLEQMQQTMKKLKWDGGEADMGVCPHDGKNYPCVRVMKSWGQFGKAADYFILDPK
ncbi:hypothetical protein N5212_004764 [Vibrio parahaemolyticus]|nr:hypothetical protein [Vibrio parahaemolyticus]EJV0279319.1 hypothetical protein [Vibrio parahaemolyticus]EKO3653481.1 hypothetical protein [Vibrio metschnikovii]HBC3831656.1 hypothetical protein [Vibrio parahaemolyticus]